MGGDELPELSALIGVHKVTIAAIHENRPEQLADKAATVPMLYSSDLCSSRLHVSSLSFKRQTNFFFQFTAPVVGVAVKAGESCQRGRWWLEGRES
eukprot:2814396-Pleurochrysis_carterae.AAC.1